MTIMRIFVSIELHKSAKRLRLFRRAIIRAYKGRLLFGMVDEYTSQVVRQERE